MTEEMQKTIDACKKANKITAEQAEAIWLAWDIVKRVNFCKKIKIAFYTAKDVYDFIKGNYDLKADLDFNLIANDFNLQKTK
jgi:hypothetical protein